MFDVHAALHEVQTKTAAQIEQETAQKWAARAVACFTLYRQTNDLRWLLRGEHYKDEAIEHAAFVDDEGVTQRGIRVLMSLG